MFQQKVILICLFVSLISSVVFASGIMGNKTPDSCEAVGAVTVKCYECTNNVKRYLGKVAVLAGYEEDQGKKFCVRENDAKTACSQAFSVPMWSIGYKANYSLGLGNAEETYKTPCVEAAGN